MASWKELYESYSRRVYRFLLSLTGSEDDAEELLQETFYQAFLHIDQFEGRCSPYTWLCQIGKHAWFRESRRRSRFRTLEAAAQMADPDPTPEFRTVAADTAARTRRAIQSLPEPYREVVALHLYAGLPLKEIAMSMGKSESWARVTYYRARQKILEEVET